MAVHNRPVAQGRFLREAPSISARRWPARQAADVACWVAAPLLLGERSNTRLSERESAITRRRAKHTINLQLRSQLYTAPAAPALGRPGQPFVLCLTSPRVVGGWLGFFAVSPFFTLTCFSCFFTARLHLRAAGLLSPSAAPPHRRRAAFALPSLITAPSMQNVLWTVALCLNAMELIMGAEFILTALAIIQPVPPLAALPWVYSLLRASPDAAAPLCLYGSGLGCLGLSGTFALVTGEGPSRHGSLFFGTFHWAIAFFCSHFRHLEGLFPGGLLFHGLVGTLFLATFPAAGKPKTH